MLRQFVLLHVRTVSHFKLQQRTTSDAFQPSLLQTFSKCDALPFAKSVSPATRLRRPRSALKVLAANASHNAQIFTSYTATKEFNNRSKDIPTTMHTQSGNCSFDIKAIPTITFHQAELSTLVLVIELTID
jgi:hypothetical protein